MPAPRPSLKRLDTKGFIEEMGDAQIDVNTLKELNTLSGKSTDPELNLEKILDEQEEQQQAPPSKPALPEPPAQEEENKDVPLPPELQRAMDLYKAQVDAELQVSRKALETVIQNYRQPAPPPQPVKPEEPPPPFMQWSREQLNEYAQQDPFGAAWIQQQQHSYVMEQRIKQLEAQETSAKRRYIGQRFDDAVREFKQNNPDLNDYIPNELLSQARQMSVESGNEQADFQGWLAQAYWVQAGPKLRQAKPDELTKKRQEQQRQTSIKATAAAGGGAGAYQAPNVNVKKSMRDRRNDALAEVQSWEE